MNNNSEKRIKRVYYFLFPLFVCFLCFVSFYIGYQKGIYHITHDQDLEKIVDRKVFKKPEKLSFFDDLHEKEKVITPSKKPLKPLDDGKASLDVAKDSVEKSVKLREKVVEKPVEAFSESLVIQLSAFKEEKKAKELLDSLQSKGFVAFLISDEEKNKGQLWHRIFVGPYEKRIKAEESIQKLEQKGYGKGFVVERPVP